MRKSLFFFNEAPIFRRSRPIVRIVTNLKKEMIHFSLEISSGAVTKPLEQSLGDDVFVILFARFLICG